jgi:hypothetical protein
LFTILKVLFRDSKPAGFIREGSAFEIGDDKLDQAGLLKKLE